MPTRRQTFGYGTAPMSSPKPGNATIPPPDGNVPSRLSASMQPSQPDPQQGSQPPGDPTTELVRLLQQLGHL